ncbi:hypothetical protein [Nibrella viscosa]|uniref:hypothetical protein n=1 Tax=Nibrella viscosa TaxID=1084524 RepID=UPI0031E5F401
MLLACYSAFSAPYAVPESPNHINKLTIQTYTPDIYKKKRQRPPIRRKMVLVSQVNLQTDESIEGQSESAESQHVLSGFLDMNENDFRRWIGHQTQGSVTYFCNRSFWCIPPDSPPPQLLVTERPLIRIFLMRY